MKILVVDDSRTIRMIVRRTLRQAGLGNHDVVEAENDQEALDAILADKPDLVLCDWNMPVMSGIELLEALQSRGIKLPFGFVTSQNTPTMKDRARQAGAWFVISKPFTADPFKAVIGKLQQAA